MQLGYCTNVHAGADLETTRANLEEHAVAVKQLFSPDQPMGIGLWLSSEATQSLGDQELKTFKNWLDQEGLIPFTFNGFPFGDFHQPVVKHAVYLPTWSEQDRLDYTTRLFQCMDTLLPEGMRGSISTLPLGWGNLAVEDSFLENCGVNLARLAEQLESLEERTGRLIQICLEPEPGCAIDTADDLVDFFERFLLAGDTSSRERHLRYLGVCHDICHSAVMNESQSHAVTCYQEHEIIIGKVQVSAAIQFVLPSKGSPSHENLMAQLGEFAEDRYLHQTTVKSEGTDEAMRFYDDLPLAMHACGLEDESTQWRTHFHVPIYRKHLGLLESTQDEIREFLMAISETKYPVNHFEVETYAWGVLPTDHQVDRLAEGIAQELDWFQNLHYSSGLGRKPNEK